MHLLVVRHGESTWNADGRWQGQADPPLSELGRAQARAASRGLGQVDAIVASPLVRAFETATIIGEELGVGPVLGDRDLIERDAGEWSGLTRAEIDERYPGWLEPPPDNEHTSFGPAGPRRRRRPPGWEDDEALLARGLSALARLERMDADDVLVVTHGGLIYTLERHLGAQFQRAANLEGRWIHVANGHRRLGDRVRLVDPDDVPVTVPDQL
jgi:probable phosphoglycerate mutase